MCVAASILKAEADGAPVERDARRGHGDLGGVGVSWREGLQVGEADEADDGQREQEAPQRTGMGVQATAPLRFKNKSRVLIPTPTLPLPYPPPPT